MVADRARKFVRSAAGCAGILVVLLLILISTWYMNARPMTRVPYNIPYQQLVQIQLETLGSAWTGGDGGLHTEDIFTKGEWAFYGKLIHSDYRYGASEELHTFANPLLARLWVFPSPRAVNIQEETARPSGWYYEPAHADRFFLDCSPEETPKFCYFLASYQEYSIVFGTDVAGAMTIEDLQRLIEATDEFMYGFLSNTTLEAGKRPIPALERLP